MSFQAGSMGTGAVLATVAQVGETAGKYLSIMGNSRNLIGLSQSARVEPLTLVDSDCVGLDYTPDVLQALQSMFTGYWLQGLAMLTDLSGCNVVRILDQINPSRDPQYLEFAKSMSKKGLGLETAYYKPASYRWGLPSKEAFYQTTAAMEAGGGSGGSAVSDKAIQTAQDVSSLCVGKLINVKIRKNNEEAEVPVAIRLMVAEIPRDTMVALVGDAGQNRSFGERLFEWRSGRIGFIKDLVLCNDLIRERKKMLAKDKEGVYSEVRRRQAAHKQAGMLSGDVSAAEASNLYVISKDTADELTARFGLSFDDFSSRQKIFDNTNAMIIAVIDRDYERVTFYHAGIRQTTNLGVRDVKVSNKGTGPSIMDIFQSYKEGAAFRP